MSRPISSIPLKELEAELAARKQQLDDAEKKRADLQDQLNAVDSLILTLRGDSNVPPPTPAAPASSAQRAVATAKANNKTLADYAIAVLKQVRKPLKAMDLAERIIAKGYKTSSQISIFRSSVASALARDDRFVNTGNASYTLKEFHTPQKAITIEPPK
jgi:hypothetical protein